MPLPDIPLPLRFMGSFDLHPMDAYRTMKLGGPLTRPSDTLSPSEGEGTLFGRGAEDARTPNAVAQSGNSTRLEAYGCVRFIGAFGLGRTTVDDLPLFLLSTLFQFQRPLDSLSGLGGKSFRGSVNQAGRPFTQGAAQEAELFAVTPAPFAEQQV